MSTEVFAHQVGQCHHEYVKPNPHDGIFAGEKGRSLTMPEIRTISLQATLVFRCTSYESGGGIFD
jgi:hypothetical protein